MSSYCKRDYTDSNDPWGLNCNPYFDLTENADSNVIEDYVEEHLAIGGAKINVFKLLGVHEQGILEDLSGNGRAISSGDSNGFPASNVFDKVCDTWRSALRGKTVINNAFIGYDFGPIRKCERDVYGIDTKVVHHITTINIRQSPSQNRRATKVRVERSLNGSDWQGVAVIDLDDNDDINQYSFHSSAPARYWRLRPLQFNGAGTNDIWEVDQLEMFEYEKTNITNLQQELGIVESRDRDYTKQSIPMKAYYDLLDAKSEMSKSGLGWDMSGQTLYFTVSFSATIEALGRPFVVGDILEVPSEIQYNTNLEKVRKYMEVYDVGWSVDGYTPGWKPTMQRLIVEPVYASQETMDLFPDIAHDIDKDGNQVYDTPFEQEYADLTNFSDNIKSQAENKLPQYGTNTFDVADIPEETVAEYEKKGFDLSNISLKSDSLYVEDGLPPNGEPYTEGNEFPQNPSDRDYHRLTYTQYNDNIPPRLYRFSNEKNRWVYLETDRRQYYNRIKPSMQDILDDYHENNNRGNNK